MKVEFFKHNIGDDEKASLIGTLDSLFLTTGERVRQFEKEFATYMNVRHCVAVTSCTEALIVCMKALGIGPGDEVITTPLTFAATSLAIIHAGAHPVWVDVEGATGNIDVSMIENAITEKTRAILPVHLYGQMCDMRKIREIADRYGLVVIEDCAHSLESQRDGVRPGQLSDAACFSFYATKSITCGEGGALITNCARLAEKAKCLRLHGINSGAEERYTKRYEHWDLLETGMKCNMSDIQASLLLPQIKKIDRFWERRREIYTMYEDAFYDLKKISMPRILPGSKSAYHLFTIWVAPETRDFFLSRLQDRGIGVAVHYRAIHLLTAFQRLYGKKRGDFPIAEKIGDSTISLPIYPRLTDEEVAHVIETVMFLCNSM